MTHHTRARRLATLILAIGAASAALVGCGGGGGGSPTPTAVVPTGTTVVVQLRDTAGNLVDGIVTLGTQRRATTDGQVSFANVAVGAQSASAEVNGRTYSQNFLATAGTTTVQITVDPGLTPTPSGTVPAPPPL